MTGRLAGKVALVSGGARGMGASHVRTVVAEGAKVVFGDILDAEGELVAKEVGMRPATSTSTGSGFSTSISPASFSASAQ